MPNVVAELANLRLASSISTAPIVSVNTVFDRVPIRTLPDLPPAESCFT